MIDLSKSRRTPYAHQIVGTEWLTEFVDPDTGRNLPGCHFLADDMRLGKTKQVIDAACHLYQNNEIDQVLVVAPAPVRSVWFDEDLGELKKHLWEEIPHTIVEYHNSREAWGNWKPDSRSLRWLITNYEFVGYDVKKVHGEWVGWHLDPLLRIIDHRTWLILDESSWIKSFNAKRTKACIALRSRCRGVVLLNGTPISQSPGDMFAQAFIMDPRILGCENPYQFRAHYAKMKPMRAYGRHFQKVTGWTNLSELQQRMKPYMMRRLRSECLDLPPKLDPVTMTVTLDGTTWKRYQELREDMITWLNENKSVSGAQAAVRVMRLAQLTAGFLGGIEEEVPCPCDGKIENCQDCGGSGFRVVKQHEPQEVSREKLDFVLGWVKQRLEEEPEFRMLIWCRFRPEIARLGRELLSHFPQIRIAQIHGGQKKEVRNEALRLMHPEAPPYSGPAILVGTIGTGSVGLNMAGAHEVVYASNGNSLFHRKQSEDRPHGPGQTQPVSYHDIIAEGPKGQRTIDHTIVKALHDRDEIAEWTASAWVTKLLLEERQ